MNDNNLTTVMFIAQQNAENLTIITIAVVFIAFMYFMNQFTET